MPVTYREDGATSFHRIDDLEQATQLDSAGLLWWCNPDGGSPWQIDADPWMEGHLGAEGWTYLKEDSYLPFFLRTALCSR